MKEKLDLKDKKILYELDKDSRQSFQQIGKKVRLSREVVQYRIKQLEIKGIIKSYQTIIDMTKLGYINCRLFIKFQKNTPHEETKIIDYYKKHPKFWWVDSVGGFRDLGLACWTKNVYEFYEIKEDLLKRFGKYIDHLHISFYIKIWIYGRNYLIDNKRKDIIEQSMCSAEKAEFDKKDLKILKLLADNARINIVEISSKTGISPTNINFRIKELIRKGIIVRFKVLLDLEKIGFYWYKVEMQLENFEVKNEMLGYFRNHSNIVYAYETISDNDLEFELEVESYEKFREILEEIRQRFGKDIKKYHYMLWFKEHKFLFMPEL